MKKLRKVCSLMLVISICLCGFTAKANEKPMSSVFNEANELLSGLGMDDASDKAGENISRKDFMNLLLKNSFYEQFTPNQLADFGIYASADYYFMPDMSMLLKDAAIICVKALGYRMNGKRNEWYLAQANYLHLFNGIGNDSMNTEMTYADAYILIFNYLKANYEGLASYDDNVSFRGEKSCLLYEKHDLIIVEGQVDAAGVMSINGTPLSENRISISGNVYENIRYKDEDIFGRRVKAYISNVDDGGKVIALLKNSSVSECDIYSYDDPVYSREGFRYSDSKGNIKTIKVSDKADIFFNGSKFSYDESLIVPKNGKITVIDNSVYSNGADTVLIESASSQEITGLNTNEYYLYSKAAKYVFEGDTPIYDGDGKKIDFSSLTLGSVVSIYSDQKGKVWKAVLCDDVISGVLGEVSKNGFTIDGIEYRVSDDILSEISKYIGEEITVTLDEYDTVAAVKIGGGSSGQIGIMQTAGYKAEGLKEGVIQFKIFGQDGNASVYDGARVIRINSVSYNDHSKAFASLETVGGAIKQSVAFYKTDQNGKILEISFPSDKIMDQNSDLKIYKTSSDKSGTIKYRKFSNAFGKEVYCGSTTVIYRIPRQESDGSLPDNDEFYTSFNCSQVDDQTVYSSTNITGYSTNKNSKMSEYLVMDYDASEGSGGMVGTDTRLSMIGDISCKVNSDGGVVECITIYNKNIPKGKTIYGKDDKYFTNLRLEKGDLVRVTYQSATSTVRAIEPVYKRGSQTLVNGTSVHDGSGSGVGQISEIYISRVYKTWGKVIDTVYSKVNPENVNQSDIKPILADMYGIFEYDSQKNMVITRTYNDLISYDVAGSNASLIVVDDRWLDPISIFIVK